MMKTSANCDNNRNGAPLDLFPHAQVLEGQYGEGYFGRVYRTSLIVLAIAAAAAGTRGGLPALVGLAYGAAISLGGLRLNEVMVRRLFRPGVRLNRKRVTGLMLLKLPPLSVVLAGAAWLAVSHLANPFALVGGLALVQAVIFLKAVGSLLVAAFPSEPARDATFWLKTAPWRPTWHSGEGLEVSSRGVRAQQASSRVSALGTHRAGAKPGLPSPELSTLN